MVGYMTEAVAQRLHWDCKYFLAKITLHVKNEKEELRMRKRNNPERSPVSLPVVFYSMKTCTFRLGNSVHIGIQISVFQGYTSG
jgi:hypothetical protein